jgi:hypothetical protein
LHILSERKLGWTLRKKQAIRHINLIRGFRPRQQFGHFGLDWALAGMCRLALVWIVVPSSSTVPDLSRASPRGHTRFSQPPEVQEGRRASTSLLVGSKGAVDYRKQLDWLRNGFFEQHCTLLWPNDVHAPTEALLRRQLRCTDVMASITRPCAPTSSGILRLAR